MNKNKFINKKFFIWLFFFLNIAGIFFIWFSKSTYYIQNPADGNFLVALGRITGLLGEYFLLTELVLVGRIQFIEHAFGFDRLNKFHRWIGYSILSFLLAHPILLIVGYAKINGVTFISQLGDFLANKGGVLAAYIALMFLIFIVILSIVIVRKKLRYETWYFTHLFTYLAIGLALNHQLGSGDLRGDWPLNYWYILNFSVFGFVLLYRFLRPLYLFALHRFFIEDIVEETPGVWSIYVYGKNINKFKFEAGQYANINILSRGMWYTHPFSFSSDYNGVFIRFSIKSLGDYTSKISNLKSGTRIIIDGPLGLFTEKISERDKYLLIAGGIGITPIRAMTESLLKKNKDTSVLFGCRTGEDMTFKKEFDNLTKQAPNLLKTDCILGTPSAGFESGYIDKEKIVRLVPDFYEREVFLCGPPMMMQAVVKNLKDLGFSENNIHYEKFSF